MLTFQLSDSMFNPIATRITFEKGMVVRIRATFRIAQVKAKGWLLFVPSHTLPMRHPQRRPPPLPSTTASSLG